MKRLLFVAAAVGATFLGSAVVGAFLEDESAEERVEQYLTGQDDAEYVSTEGHFRATFPGRPDRSTENLDADGTSIPAIYFVKDLGDAAFAVAVFELKPGAAFDLDGAVNGAAAAVKGTVVSATRVKVQGFDAVEFVLSAPDALFLKAVMARTPDRAYQVQVGGKQNPPGGYDKFKASFQITP